MSGERNAAPALDPDQLELAPGTAHENLEGWVPELSDETEIRNALDKAFDYRGDVTLTLRDGAVLEGYVFDRRCGPVLAECSVRIFPKNAGERISIPYSHIARLVFSGPDRAAGKSWEAWVKKWNEKKAAGEKGFGLHPEKLD
jgi:hypothetical protein